MKLRKLKVLYLAILVILIIIHISDRSYSDTHVKFIKAKVIKIVDGDTIWVKIKVKRYKVRFIGVNTPELSHPGLGIKEEPYGEKAKRFTERYLEDRTIYLELDVQEFDRYGRLLAYIWLKSPDKIGEKTIRRYMFNAILLIKGYAQVMTVPPNVKYQDWFLKFQREAIREKAGLWRVK